MVCAIIVHVDEWGSWIFNLSTGWSTDNKTNMTKMKGNPKSVISLKCRLPTKSFLAALKTYTCWMTEKAFICAVKTVTKFFRCKNKNILTGVLNFIQIKWIFRVVCYLNCINFLGTSNCSKNKYEKLALRNQQHTDNCYCVLKRA